MTESGKLRLTIAGNTLFSQYTCHMA